MFRSVPQTNQCVTSSILGCNRAAKSKTLLKNACVKRAKAGGILLLRARGDEVKLQTSTRHEAGGFGSVTVPSGSGSEVGGKGIGLTKDPSAALAALQNSASQVCNNPVIKTAIASTPSLAWDVNY